MLKDCRSDEAFFLRNYCLYLVRSLPVGQGMDYYVETTAYMKSSSGSGYGLLCRNYCLYEVFQWVRVCRNNCLCLVQSLPVGQDMDYYGVI